MSDTVYVNGEWVPAGEATVPVADRGFRFGDGVFETIAVHHGRLYQGAWHLARLREGLQALAIDPPEVAWDRLLQELITRNDLSEGFIRLAVSRGVGSRGYLPVAGIRASLIIEPLPAVPPPCAPATLWLGTYRRPSPAAFPTHVKSSQGLTSTLGLLEAHARQCDEGLLLDDAGHLCEATSANLFWLADATIYTPGLSTGCVMGSTRAAIMRLAPVREVQAPLAALQAAECVWLSNCRVGLWPVQALQPQGWRWPPTHPRLQALQAHYADDIARECA